MKNVYYVGSGELTFDLIERIINENLKLELAPEAKERIQKCRDSSPTLQAWLLMRFSCKVPSSSGEMLLLHREPKPVVIP